MHRFARIVLLACFPAVAAAQPRDARVEALLKQMTLEEKIGEMTQIDISAVTSVTGTSTRGQQIDSAKLHDIVITHNVGSLLNVAGVALTQRQWVEVITMVQRFAQRRRLPIPVIYGIDAVHGHQYMRQSTVFPHNINMAATWNPILVRESNVITAQETRASGIPWNFSPVLDVGRQPLWSRLYETFGEDPYLVSVMGVQAVRGLQNNRGADSSTPLGMTLAATGKHFLGYSMPLSGKDRTGRGFQNDSFASTSCRHSRQRSTPGCARSW